MKKKIEKDKAAVALGKRGRASTLKRYGLSAFKEWGKKGGRPPKKKKDNKVAFTEVINKAKQ
jgi:hypothetical protein